MTLLIVLSSFMYIMGYIVSLYSLHCILNSEPCNESIAPFEYILIILWPIVVVIGAAVSIGDWFRSRKNKVPEFDTGTEIDDFFYDC